MMLWVLGIPRARDLPTHNDTINYARGWHGPQGIIPSCEGVDCGPYLRPRTIHTQKHCVFSYICCFNYHFLWALNGHLRPLNSTWVHFLINCWLNVVTSVLNQVSLGPKKVPLRPS